MFKGGELTITLRRASLPSRPGSVLGIYERQTEVHIMHGLFAPWAAFFSNTTKLQKISPGRAKTRMGTIPDGRTLNPFVSFEERVVVKVCAMRYIIAKRRR